MSWSPTCMATGVECESVKRDTFSFSFERNLRTSKAVMFTIRIYRQASRCCRFCFQLFILRVYTCSHYFCNRTEYLLSRQQHNHRSTTHYATSNLYNATMKLSTAAAAAMTISATVLSKPAAVTASTSKTSKEISSYSMPTTPASKA